MTVAFVAEVSSNHNQDLSRALQFIDQAAAIGCQAVKFQLFKIHRLFAPEILAKSPQHRDRQAWELPVEFLPVLSAHCRALGLKFGCTPFYLEAVAELWPFVDFYKIASYELLWEDLLKECAQTGKEVILSTGMATMPEIQQAVATLRNQGGENLTLLHCVSGYPAPPEECNLAAMETMRQSVDCPVGWSDHSVTPGVIYRAVHRWGASLVEFHLDLEGKGEEYQTGHCWLPEQIKAVIAAVHAGQQADGSGRKEPRPSERGDRDWRADPRDGLRPSRKIRELWRESGAAGSHHPGTHGLDASAG
ncbi:MAG: N-acetylneuraminate synthase family protein [Desulfobaccales bacterium]